MKGFVSPLVGNNLTQVRGWFADTGVGDGMDTKTFELHENIDDAQAKLKAQGVSDEETRKRLVGLSDDEYNQLKLMNRKERRKWLRENRKKK
jgi:hypothetical protein